MSVSLTAFVNVAVVTVLAGSETGESISAVQMSGTLKQSGNEENGYITIDPETLVATYSTTKSGVSSINSKSNLNSKTIKTDDVEKL